jgi:hypothetical protein
LIGAFSALLFPGAVGCRGEAKQAAPVVSRVEQAAVYRAALAPEFTAPDGEATVVVAKVAKDGTVSRGCVQDVDSAVRFFMAPARSVRPVVK